MTTERTAVFGFGRTNPPTTGHEVLLKKIGATTTEHGGEGHFVASHSEGTAKDPLPQHKKISYLKKMSPHNVAVSGSSKESPTFMHAAKKFHQAGYHHLVMVAGSDRVEEYHKILHKYNGKDYHFKSIKVVSAGQRDPDSEGASGISGTKMRKHARSGDLKAFKAGLPKALHPHAKEISDHIRSVKEGLISRFKEYLSEASNRPTKALHVYDIDDTLVHPTSKINIKNGKGGVVRSLNTQEYAKSTRKPLPTGHSYDFGEFRSAEKFSKESKPINSLISHVRLMSADKGNKVIFNTARANLDDKHKFISTFKKQGVDMSRIRVHRAGNIKSSETGPQKKARITSSHITSHKPKDVHMYDDDKGNLDHFLALKKKHPSVNFYAHHVQPNGTKVPYETK